MLLKWGKYDQHTKLNGRGGGSIFYVVHGDVRPLTMHPQEDGTLLSSKRFPVISALEGLVYTAVACTGGGSYTEMPHDSQEMEATSQTASV